MDENETREFYKQIRERILQLRMIEASKIDSWMFGDSDLYIEDHE